MKQEMDKGALPRSLFEQGLALHRKGQLAGACERYRQALEADPAHFDSLHLLGVAALQERRPAEALALIDRAIVLHAGNPAFFSNRGNALRALGRAQEALESYDRALALDPAFADARGNRAVALSALQRDDEALACYDELLRGGAGKADTHFNRGNVLSRLGRPADAAASYERALSLDPRHLAAHRARARALQGMLRYREALESLERALALGADDAEIHFERGNVLLGSGRAADALASFDAAVRHQPDYADAHTNRGHALRELGRWAPAVASYDLALRLKPDDADVHVNRGLCLLALGDLEQGWREHEWRLVANPPRVRHAPDWDGAPLGGNLLVLPEQGVGDQVFYSGMLNDVRGCAGAVTVCVDPRLVPLYARSFEGMAIVPSDTPLPACSFDAQVQMASLGRFFRSDTPGLAHVRVPYLHADATRVAELRRRIATPGRLVCGLSWASRSARSSAHKSLRLQDLLPLLRLDGIDFVDLQYGDMREEQAALRAAHGVALSRVPDIDNRDDLDGLAALIGACDLVVTVSNTTAHLAAALGKPAQVMLPFSGGLLWYWHVDSERSPWYPAARLIRQAHAGDWTGVVARVREALAGTVAKTVP